MYDFQLNQSITCQMHRGGEDRQRRIDGKERYKKGGDNEVTYRMRTRRNTVYRQKYKTFKFRFLTNDDGLQNQPLERDFVIDIPPVHLPCNLG